MGKFFTRCRVRMKFCTRVRLKPSNDHGEFELDRAKTKNYITENSVALGHETHNRCRLSPHFCKTIFFLNYMHISKIQYIVLKSVFLEETVVASVNSTDVDLPSNLVHLFTPLQTE